MPTTAERDIDADSFNSTLQESFQSWTDDLPVCHCSGVGYSTNRVYHPDGSFKEEHEYQNRSFHFCIDLETSFYGVFDGHFGCKAVEFASQRLPAEILLGQLKDKKGDVEIKELLQQAFLTVETSFFQTIDNLLAEKEDLKLQLQGLDLFESVKQEPIIVQKLNSVIAEIESGTTAVVALVHQKRLYVANAGDCRALLCKTSATGTTQVLQLSVDHNFQNEDELLRLSQLGLNIENMCAGTGTVRRDCTRCIGNYVVKGGYKEFGNLSEASEEPIIAEPEVIGGIDLDSSCVFLILMSGGLYKSLEEATGTHDGNKMIVEMFNEQYLNHSNLNDSAQAVIDKVADLHFEAYVKDRSLANIYKKREDITLLVLNVAEFLAEESEIHLSPSATPIYRAVPFHDGIMLPDASPPDSSSPSTTQHLSEPQNTSPVRDSSGDQTTSTVEIPTAGEARIPPYVDFTDFFSAVEEAHERGEVHSDWRRQHACK